MIVRSAVGVLLAVVLSACGVPDSGAPMADGTPRPVVEDEPVDPLSPPRPEEASDSEQAVRLYLQAASSAWGNLREQVRSFLSEDGRSVLQPSNTITVVRIDDWGEPEIRSSYQHRITVRGRVVGALTEAGQLVPARGVFKHTFRMQLTRLGNTSAWLVDNPPPGYALSDEALTERFDALSLYFSNRLSRASLVPDLRYLPKAIEWKKQRSLLVDQLLEGPSRWLSAVTDRGFPNGTTRRGNVYLEDGRVVVNLSREAEESDRTDLMLAQLVWTLRPRMPAGGQLELRIDDRPVSHEGRTTQPRTAFHRFNAIAAQPVDGLSYYVTNRGAVRPLPFRGRPDDTPAVLVGRDRGTGAEHNTSISSAALNRAGNFAAVVRGEPGSRSLRIGTRARSSAAPSYQKVTGLPSGDLGRPAWARSLGQTLLVPANGRLFAVDVGTLRARRVIVPRSLRRITAVSVAPDGFRLALVAGGRLHVAGLTEENQRVEVADARLVTDQVRRATDVAWSQEHWLVAAGVGPSGEGVHEVSVNGLIATLPTSASGVPDQVAAYPKLDKRGRVLVAQDGRVYEVYSKTATAPGDADTPPVGGAPFFAF